MKRQISNKYRFLRSSISVKYLVRNFGTISGFEKAKNIQKNGGKHILPMCLKLVGAFNVMYRGIQEEMKSDDHRLKTLLSWILPVSKEVETNVLLTRIISFIRICFSYQTSLL